MKHKREFELDRVQRRNGGPYVSKIDKKPGVAMHEDVERVEVSVLACLTHGQ